jgi:hypothetical protein
LLLAVVLLAAPVARSAAQQRTVSPRTGWLPRVIADHAPQLSASERAAALATLEQIERIMLAVPELAYPSGFQVVPHFSLGDTRLPGTNTVVSYRYSLMFFVPAQSSAAASCECLSVVVNFPPTTSAGMPYHDERGREIYIEPPRSELLPGATQVYDRLSPNARSSVTVLFTQRGELPWSTVTREEFYRAVIYDVEGNDGARLADYRKSLETTPYQQWLVEATRRRQEREQLLKALAPTQSAAELAQTRRTMEENDRQVGESLKATEARDRAANERARAELYTDKVRAELGSMTPAERSAPASIDFTAKDGPFATGWRIASGDARSNWRVLTPNLDFWRARGSRADRRGIAVRLVASGAGEIPAVHRALWQTYQKLDWNAIHRLLERPR